MLTFAILPVTSLAVSKVYLADSSSQVNYMVGRMHPEATVKLLLASGHCDYLVRVDETCENYVRGTIVGYHAIVFCLF